MRRLILVLQVLIKLVKSETQHVLTPYQLIKSHLAVKKLNLDYISGEINSFVCQVSTNFTTVFSQIKKCSDVTVNEYPESSQGLCRVKAVYKTTRFVKLDLLVILNYV